MLEKSIRFITNKIEESYSEWSFLQSDYY